MILGNKRDNKILKISTAIDKLFENEICKSKNYQKARTVFIWKSLNTDAVNRYTKKVYVYQSCLYVYIAHAVVRHQLYMLKSSYLKRINMYLTDCQIKDIIFR